MNDFPIVCGKCGYEGYIFSNDFDVKLDDHWGFLICNTCGAVVMFDLLYYIDFNAIAAQRMARMRIIIDNPLLL